MIKKILSMTLVILLANAAQAQKSDFTLLKGGLPNNTPKIIVDETKPEKEQKTSVELQQLKAEVSPISILVTESATIKETIDGKKAVFIKGDVEKKNKGVIIKLVGEFKKPLLRYYQAPKFFPPKVLSPYSENEWFFYGENGTYVVEILDSQDSSWFAEYLEVKIEGAADEPPADDEEPPESEEPPADDDEEVSKDFQNVLKITKELIPTVNDPTVARILYDSYLEGYSKLDNQSLEEMRKIMVQARRSGYEKATSRNAYWNEVLLKIDKEIGDITNTDDYKKAMYAFVEGFRQAISK